MLSDLLAVESEYKMGDNLIADGTDVVDVSGDVPDLSEADGKTLWVAMPDGYREYRTVNAVNDSTDRMGLTSVLSAGTGLSWGLVDNSVVAAMLSSYSQRPIPPHIVKRYFRETDLWQSSPGGFAGKLEVARTDPATPASVVAWLNEFWAVVYDGAAESCGTTVFQYAREVKDVVDYLVSSGVITQSEADGFYELGGGLRYPGGVTTTDIQNERDANKQSVYKQLRRNAVLSRRSELKNKVETALAAFDDYYRNADYSTDIDHAAAAMQAADSAYSNFTP